MKKKGLLIAVLAMIMTLAVAGCGEKKYTPTFMYFVSESDANYDEAMAVVAELEDEYGKKINFDIHNIDETPEDKENFPVDGQTPTLIMLNTKNDPSAFEFQCTDKETLKKDIDAALAAE